jgi:cytochrome c
MSRWHKGAAAVVLAALVPVAGAQGPKAKPDTAFSGIGRAATADEIRAWDIDVRPDFKGLPKGRGSVAEGQDLWEAKCASCHGVFGELTDVFTPIATGVVKADIARGRVSGLTKEGGQRSSMMKVATVSTLWDYINRAMPWNAPKSLSVNEVYAATAYVLNLADVVPGDFVLSDANIAEVQARMPNRLGMTTKHGMWLPTAKPDVQGSKCMKDCAPVVKIASALPDYAKNAHGNLADQMRLVGGMRGVVTSDTATAAAAPKSEHAAVRELSNKATCMACHGVDKKIVGPGFNEVVARYKSDATAEAYLAKKIRSGGQGVWGSIPMPPDLVSEADAVRLAQWILKGAPD